MDNYKIQQNSSHSSRIQKSASLATLTGILNLPSKKIRPLTLEYCYNVATAVVAFSKVSTPTSSVRREQKRARPAIGGAAGSRRSSRARFVTPFIWWRLSSPRIGSREPAIGPGLRRGPGLLEKRKKKAPANRALRTKIGNGTIGSVYATLWRPPKSALAK